MTSLLLLLLLVFFFFFFNQVYTTNSQDDQLPVGLLAQLVEHCAGISEVMGSNLLFDLSSAVSYIYIHLFILLGYITNSQYNQFPVGLIAQLIEHCTGIAEVMA